MTTLIRIGNSQGVRIPKAIIEQAKLAEKKLSFEVTQAGLLIKPIAPNPREGWAAAFAKANTENMQNCSDDDWLSAPLSESTDETWQW